MSESNEHPIAGPSTSTSLYPGAVIDRDKESFHPGSRYLGTVFIAKGTFGMVAHSMDTETYEEVAIKRIKPFESRTESKRTLREMRFLIRLQHENIVDIVDIVFRDMEIYLILEFMDNNLRKLLHEEEYSDEDIPNYLYQILRALKYIHSANIIHRDLKPDNILVNIFKKIKICDFGMARVAFPRMPDTLLTGKVQNEIYRAPEVWLNKGRYTKAIDMWSVGCIFGEFFLKRPVFAHFTNEEIHLKLIFEFIDKPTARELRDNIAEAEKRKYARSLLRIEQLPMVKVFNTSDPVVHDLLKKLLKFVPNDRITAEDSLAHPYLEQLHNEENEPKFTTPFGKEMEPHRKLEKEKLKSLMRRERLFLKRMQLSPDKVSPSSKRRRED